MKKFETTGFPEEEFNFTEGIFSTFPTIATCSGLYECIPATPGVFTTPGMTVQNFIPNFVPGVETTTTFPTPVFPTATPEAFTTGFHPTTVNTEVTIPGFAFKKEELRLDVDRFSPLMTCSGTIFLANNKTCHWIANCTKVGQNTFFGTIWFKNGETGIFPFTNCTIQVFNTAATQNKTCTVTFTGGGTITRVVTFKFKSFFFQEVNCEFDCIEGTVPVTFINTFDHPVKPATLMDEKITIDKVFSRAGIYIKHTQTETTTPITLSGGDKVWNDNELHDAMQVYWSRFADKPMQSIWTLFASIHATGQNIGGMMFNDIGPNHRQGCVVFNDSFISKTADTEVYKEAAARRNIFFTACHEIGECFNLGDSFQKDFFIPFVPTAQADTTALSFMNYPGNYPFGGQNGFFSNFNYGFTNNEMMFLRHAPNTFIQTQNVPWFNTFGFQNCNTFTETGFKLELRTNKRGDFDFMEPVMCEIKLTNITTDPIVLDKNVLHNLNNVIVIVQKDGQPAFQVHPFTTFYFKPETQVIMPGESIYEPIFVSCGLNGFCITDPGFYNIQCCVNIKNEDIVSNPIRIKVNTPYTFEETRIAQDFFNNDICRVLAFDGSRYFNKANDTLREIVDRFPDKNVAIHAQVALGMALAQDYKMLGIEEAANGSAYTKKNISRLIVAPAKYDEARTLLGNALLDNMNTSADTLGHIDQKFYIDQYTRILRKQGDDQDAVRIQDELYKTLSARKASKQVLEDIKTQIKAIQKKEETFII